MADPGRLVAGSTRLGRVGTRPSLTTKNSGYMEIGFCLSVINSSSVIKPEATKSSPLGASSIGRHYQYWHLASDKQPRLLSCPLKAGNCAKNQCWPDNIATPTVSAENQQPCYQQFTCYL